MPDRLAYMPLDTYPDALPDASIRAAVGFAAAQGYELHVATLAVDIPPVASPMGSYVIDFAGMARVAEETSRTECARLRTLVEDAVPASSRVTVTSRTVRMGGAAQAAATEARYFDLVVLPWSDGARVAQDLAEALVFGAGRPVVLVPPETRPAPLDHIAIAWDESRVAARALGDALALLPAGGRVTVLTVQDEKPLAGSGLASRLAAALQRRGYDAEPVDLVLSGRTLAATLQDAASDQGAQLLAMGGFGHSRLRDFVLGGATQGVLDRLRIPTLLAH